TFTASFPTHGVGAVCVERVPRRDLVPHHRTIADPRLHADRMGRALQKVLASWIRTRNDGAATPTVAAIAGPTGAASTAGVRSSKANRASAKDSHRIRIGRIRAGIT